MLHIVHKLQHLKTRTTASLGISQVFSTRPLKLIMLASKFQANNAKESLAPSHRPHLPKYFSFPPKRSIEIDSNPTTPSSHSHSNSNSTHHNAEIQARQSRAPHKSRQKRQRANPEALLQRARMPRRLPVLLRLLRREHAQHLPQASPLRLPRQPVRFESPIASKKPALPRPPPSPPSTNSFVHVKLTGVEMVGAPPIPTTDSSSARPK